MTMADTVAVMNAGRIEQLGNPADIYELPRTVFVANFLGQSNLLPGRKSGTSGDAITVESHGHTFTIPQSRNAAEGTEVIIGVRPEKMAILDEPDLHKVPDSHNRLTGTVIDVSYTGVSTQYLVHTEWGQDLIVFEQNVQIGDRCDVGDRVVVHWAPEHTFGLAG